MPPSTSELFISYSSKNREFVQRLAKDLSDSGITVWWDQQEVQLGDSIKRKVQEGIDNAKWFALVLSPDSISSSWVQHELNAALAERLERKGAFILSLLYRNCELTTFLQDLVYADFRSSYDEGFQALLKRIDPPIKANLLSGLMSGKPSVVTLSYAKVEARHKYLYIERLISGLSGSSVEERIGALTGLFVIRPAGFEDWLVRAMDDSSNSVRRFAVYCLGEIRSKGSLRRISELVSDKSADVRAAARDAYRKISGQRP